MWCCVKIHGDVYIEVYWNYMTDWAVGMVQSLLVAQIGSWGIHSTCNTMAEAPPLPPPGRPPSDILQLLGCKKQINIYIYILGETAWIIYSKGLGREPLLSACCQEWTRFGFPCLRPQWHPGRGAVSRQQLLSSTIFFLCWTHQGTYVLSREITS